jgi:hypothetical protein
MISRRDFIALSAAGVVHAGLPGQAAAQAAATGSLGPIANRLILVHGRDQQGKNPDELKSEWLSALAEGAAKSGLALPDDVEIVFPFYGDKLGEFASTFEIPLTDDIQARGDAADEDFLIFQAAVAEELRQRAGVSDAQVDQEYGGDPTERGPLNWRWVQAILRALDKHAPGMSQQSIEVFLRDVFIYAHRAGVRDQVDGIVADAFNEEPVAVVGHSLGSVVAYSVMRTDRRPLQVPLYVTLGSPLGIQAVRDPFKPIGNPEPVKAWYNAFDTRDVVALNPLDENFFPIQPAIENNADVKNRTNNRHGIVGYLDDQTVAARILNALGVSR